MRYLSNLFGKGNIKTIYSNILVVPCCYHKCPYLLFAYFDFVYSVEMNNCLLLLESNSKQLLKASKEYRRASLQFANKLPTYLLKIFSGKCATLVSMY